MRGLAALVLWWRAALIAARFLTRAPLPDPAQGRELYAADHGRAALLYPLVGLLVGGLLGGLAGGLNAWLGATAAPLTATLVLGVWIWGTGALHLDGLADCADAWV
ncbi:adenosylcobinamide-GDP ribazoletransferase, partial [Rhabdochromatium marinum]|uniref:adenosylcobinamide-GDP ribazoletransferase n=1 Tax=Rhabdochromatium marinum TaxID=48729 RepID=UPI0019070F4B